ncbi:MAG: chromate transporter [Lachnospiraceae bacterium]|nr:chromate transporter [Lachnospiraceae bacterium]
MIYLRLFWEFFKIGVFAVGGGMATLPFLQDLSVRTGWFTSSFITDMVAISESTPGPIGINMATYVGYNVGGIPGGIIATLGEILPAILIVTTVSIYLEKFRGNKYVDYAFYGMRPAVCGLIAAAGWEIIKMALLRLDVFQATHRITDLVAPVRILYFVLIFLSIRKFKKHPVLYIAVSAVVGILLRF